MWAVEFFPERDCFTCTAAQKHSWGCETDCRLPIILDGEPIRRCPRRPILEDPRRYREIFFSYSRYLDGLLPEPGGLQCQPYKMIELMKEVDYHVRGAREEKEVKARRKAGRRGR